MIDEDFNVYLIEVNINPCLGVTSSFSSRFITNLVDNTMRIAIDPLFPPPVDFSGKRSSLEILPEMKYELVFDQRVDGPELDELYNKTDTSNLQLILGELDNVSDSDGEMMEEDYPDRKSVV